MSSTIHSKTLAIFASGQGSNAQKIIDYFRSNAAVNIGLIVCNKQTAGVLEIADKERLPRIIIKKDIFYETGYLEELKRYHIDFIVLAGFLWKVPPILVQAYPHRIVNIHPALLPAYGGRGMYGMNVHSAVLRAGEKNSGITIHFVDDNYDHGAVILQRRVEIAPDETPETLAAKIHLLEHQYFAPTIEKVLLGNVFEREKLTDDHAGFH